MVVHAMLNQPFGGSAQFTVGRGRFSLVRVPAGRTYCTTHLSSVFGNPFGGSAPFTVGRVRFSPVRQVQALVTAQSTSFRR